MNSIKAAQYETHRTVHDDPNRSDRHLLRDNVRDSTDQPDREAMKRKSITNYKRFNNESMTLIDYKLRRAIDIATEYHFPIKSHVRPRRMNGRIIGYYVMNEGIETAMITI